MQTESQSSILARTWWGRQWVYSLEALGENWPNRLPRGRGYAQAGKVYDLVSAPGMVTAKVSGSGIRPYRVEISLKAYSDEQWDGLIASLASQAQYTVRLLQGEMPENLLQVCEPLGLPLFPQANDDLTTVCSCPDVANPCKHVAAVLYVLGQVFDQDPFQMLYLRGMSRKDIMNALEAKRLDTNHIVLGSEMHLNLVEPVADQEQQVDYTELDPSKFWESDATSEDITFELAKPSEKMPSLRRLGTPPSWSCPLAFTQIFDPIYEDASELAQRILSGHPSQAIVTTTKQHQVLEEPVVKETNDSQVIPKLASVCQSVLIIVMDQGYIRPQDKALFSSTEQTMFSLAIQALVLEGILMKEGNGRNLRYIQSTSC